MDYLVSPKYLLRLIENISKAICTEYPSYKNRYHYIKKWQRNQELNNLRSFPIVISKFTDEINLTDTLNGIEDGNLLLQIAVDLGVETPDFIPSVATFKNEIKSDYKTALTTFESAFKQIETHPDIAIGLANSALESIVKEILKDSRVTTQQKEGSTLYELASELLKAFQLFPNSDIPVEIRTIGSSFLSATKAIETLRSTKTKFHGKTDGDYYVDDATYTYFVINSVTTVGLFLKSFYSKKFPKLTVVQKPSKEMDDLPF